MVNEYLVAEDDGLSLIDTGLAGTDRLILARARDLGMPIRRIALTHAHRDPGARWTPSLLRCPASR